MKRIVLFLMVAIAYLPINSCILEEGETPPKATRAGKLIFDCSENNISENLKLADIALKLNKYIQAPENQKSDIEDRFFPHFKPRNTGNNWVLLNSDYSLSTDGKSLETLGTKWMVRGSKDLMNNYETELEITIECIGENEWSICSNSEIVAKGILLSTSNGLPLYDYLITGRGQFLSDNSYNNANSLETEYTIKAPMRFIMSNSEYISDQYYFFKATGGKMEMEVWSNSEQNKRDLIIADLSSSIGNNVINKITFKGVTEVWQ